MRIDPHPIFRKIIVPWYDSTPACILVICAMIFVLLFGFIGLYVIEKNYDYHDHMWVPVGLILFSGVVIISTVFRLIKRYYSRSDE